MPWIYLIIAGIFEIGWPVGLKIAASSNSKFYGIIIAISCMALSGVFLYLAQKFIPISIAYAVWTSIGAIGTFIIGVIFYGDPSSIVNYLGIALIICGVCLLKSGTS